MATAVVDRYPEDEPVLISEDRGRVRILTLNRPDQFNALSESLLDALQGAFDSLMGDGDVRVVVLAARGKAFCAGHDLKEMRANPDRNYYEALFKKCSRMMVAMTRLRQPVIVRVQGIAAAAGCQLVANGDLAVASSEGAFGTTGINLGLYCMTPGVALVRNVGRKRAFEMLFTGDIISAEKAMEAGLVNRVVAPEDLDGEIDALARSVIGKSAAAVAAGKRVFYRQMEMGLETAYAYASEEMARNMMFHDAGEGIDAFIAKRKPKWEDR